mmetsp:Transcript_149312/g.478329  ORF Transcript_149312/g.478329 Transcript_149312/m.478329 type:complete len:242 (+) Transcript_149312:238-963(+)
MAKLRPHNSWITTPNPARASCIPDCACGSTRPSCRWTTRSPSDRARHRTGTAPEGPSWSCSPWEGHYGSTKPVFLSSSCSRRPSCNRSMWPPLDPGGSPCRHRVGSTRPSGRQASPTSSSSGDKPGPPTPARRIASKAVVGERRRRCGRRRRRRRRSGGAVHALAAKGFLIGAPAELPTGEACRAFERQRRRGRCRARRSRGAAGAVLPAAVALLRLRPTGLPIHQAGVAIVGRLSGTRRS